MDDSILPPVPFMDTLDDVQYLPIYLACTQRLPYYILLPLGNFTLQLLIGQPPYLATCHEYVS
jgi:hypothetical protein